MSEMRDVVIALISIVVGCVLCMLDYSSAIQFWKSLSRADAQILVFIGVGFLTYVSLVVFVPATSDDVWKVGVSLIWPAVVVFFALYGFHKCLVKLGEKVRGE